MAYFTNRTTDSLQLMLPRVLLYRAPHGTLYFCLEYGKHKIIEEASPLAMSEPTMEDFNTLDQMFRRLANLTLNVSLSVVKEQ